MQGTDSSIGRGHCNRSSESFRSEEGNDRVQKLTVKVIFNKMGLSSRSNGRACPTGLI